MVIRCRQCGSNNNSGNRLCLICGAGLLDSTESLAAGQRTSEPRKLTSVRGSSMVRPTAEANNSAVYSFQTDNSSSHLGRRLVLVLFTLTVAGACWHWQDLRMFASRFSQTPDMRQSKEPNSIQASASIPPLDVQTPQSTHPGPSELVSQRDQSATQETSSQEPSQEGPLRSSKAQVQPASASTRGRDSSETEGEKYLYGVGVPANCVRAQQDLLASAEHSSAKAQSAVGTMYATGHCATRDLPLAYRWFARAQRQNPRNRIIEEDMRVLWNQMSPEERKLATR